MGMAMMMIPNLVLFATCTVAIWSYNGNAVASAASPSPAPSAADCSTAVYELLPCVDYITIGSTKAQASNDCCKAVGDELKRNGECLCDALRQSGSMGIQLNLTRAVGLPSACAISIPLPDCGIPLPPGMALAPAPVPRTKAPSPAPTPRTKAPSPTPSSKAPSPAPTPSSKAPSPAPSRRAPAPAPTTTAPTPAPVNPPPPVSPAPGVAPSSGPTAPPAPSSDNAGPSADGSPAPAPSGAASFTISSNLIVPLLITLLVSFRPL